MARKTKAAVNAAPPEPTAEPTLTPAQEMQREAAKMEAMAYDTLLRALREGLAVQLSFGLIAVQTNRYGGITHGSSDGDDNMISLGFAMQAGLLMGAARALLAVEADASEF
jgi:hypothetical protein